MSNAEYAMLLVFAPGIKKSLKFFFFFLSFLSDAHLNLFYFSCVMIIPVLRHNLCIPSNYYFLSRTESRKSHDIVGQKSSSMHPKGFTLWII